MKKRSLLRGWIVDGSGAEPQRGAILCEAGKVLAVEKEITGASAADEIWDFRRELIAPGFIDTHGHSDLSLWAAPEGFSKCSQGIALEVAGNCGLSAFPVTPRNREHLLELYSVYHPELDWLDYTSYCAALKTRNTRLQLRPLCGHNTLRAAVAGYEKETLSAAELHRMEELLAAQLAQGCPGLSTGLLYVPGCFASPGEIEALMRVLARYDRIYTTHLRSEGDNLLESLAETLELARSAGLKRVQISHFKTAGKDNWSKLPAAVGLLEDARAGGIKVHVDRYPYTESLTQLSVVLPGAWKQLTDSAVTRKLAEPEEKKHLYTELSAAHDRAYWERMRLGRTSHPHYCGFAGKKMLEIAPDDPAQLVVELLAYDSTSATVAAAGMSEENLKTILRLPYCMCGSDGNALPPGSVFGRPHPRAFGSAPRFLRLLLDDGIPAGKAVYRLTGLPAEVFQLSGFGKIVPGAEARFAVFDPDTVDGCADFASPEAPAEGVRLVTL